MKAILARKLFLERADELYRETLNEIELAAKAGECELRKPKLSRSETQYLEHLGYCVVLSANGKDTIITW